MRTLVTFTQKHGIAVYNTTAGFFAGIAVILLIQTITNVHITATTPLADPSYISGNHCAVMSVQTISNAVNTSTSDVTVTYQCPAIQGVVVATPTP